MAHHLVWWPLEQTFWWVISVIYIVSLHFTKLSKLLQQSTGDREKPVKTAASSLLDLFCSFAFALGKLCQRACPSTQPEFVAKRWKFYARLCTVAPTKQPASLRQQIPVISEKKMPSVCFSHLYPFIMIYIPIAYSYSAKEPLAREHQQHQCPHRHPIDQKTQFLLGPGPWLSPKTWRNVNISQSQCWMGPQFVS